MTIRKPKVHAFSGRVVQFVGRNIVAHLVASVIGKPQFFRLRMPIESDAIPNTHRKYFKPRAVGLNPVNYTVTFIRSADVAGGTDRNVKHSVGTESDKLPAVMPVARKFIVHDNRLWRILKLRFNVVVTRDPENFRHVEPPTSESNA